MIYVNADFFMRSLIKKVRWVSVLDRISGMFIGLFLLMTLLLAANVLGQNQAELPLKAGFAAVNITPPLGMPMAGYFSDRFAEGEHNPLLAKAMVFEQGEYKVAILMADVISLHAGLTREIREKVQSQTGIPFDHIALAATHTHTGPLFGDQTDEARKIMIAQGGTQKLVAEYIPQLIEGCVKAIVEAAGKAQPISLAVGKAETKNIAFNRRFHMKDETVIFNPGINNPNIVKVAGPTDPFVSAILFKDLEQGKPLASFTEFALHLDTVGGNQFSADYPFFLEKSLQDKFGADFFSVFGTGTCGDINHIDVTGEKKQKAPEIGAELGEIVADLLASNMKPTKGSIGVACRKFSWPYKKFSQDEIEKGQQLLLEIKEGKQVHWLVKLAADQAVASTKRDPNGLSLEVQAIRLAEDTAIVFLPGEVFVELGMAIEKGSPFANIFVVELAQQRIAYVPTIKACKEGSYETINSLIEPGGGEKMVEMALDALKELQTSR